MQPLLVLAYFFLGFVFLLFNGKKWSGILLSLLCAVGLFLSIYTFPAEENLLKLAVDWIDIAGFQVPIVLVWDKAAFLFFSLVQGIGLAVSLFSIFYLEKELRKSHYFGFLAFFMGSMLGLVLSYTWVFIFLFWELVGFCSYLLIGFWYKKPAASQAAGKAFFINKVGDAFFLIAIGLFFANSGRFELFAQESSWVASICLILGILAKSAQFPLQVWLPDAMEGPTPVSALLHAATMVVAGVFVLFRGYELIHSEVWGMLSIIGIITTLLAGLTAISLFDIKKILAYSTIAQIGIMMSALALVGKNEALFHVSTHAFFKAGLFLLAGIWIHQNHHEQDIRKLKTKNPLLLVYLLVLGAALAGLPFTSGYLSKENILLPILEGSTSLFWKGLFVIGLLLTPVYVAKLTYFLFKGLTQHRNWHFSYMEIIVLPLVLGSFSLPYWDFYASMFPVEKVPHSWVGNGITIVVFLLFLLAFLWFRTKGNLLEKELFTRHFYLDLFYGKIGNLLAGPREKDYPVVFHYLFSKEPKKKVDFSVAGMLHWIDLKIIDGLVHASASLSLGLSKISNYIDTKWIDGFLHAFSSAVAYMGERLRRVQSGKLQEYLTATILIVIFVAVLVTFLSS